jgi:hypothetical protein
MSSASAFDYDIIQFVDFLFGTAERPQAFFGELSSLLILSVFYQF